MGTQLNPQQASWAAGKSACGRLSIQHTLWVSHCGLGTSASTEEALMQEPYFGHHGAYTLRMEVCVNIDNVMPGRSCYFGDGSSEPSTQAARSCWGRLFPNAYCCWSTAYQTQKIQSKFKYDSMLLEIRAFLYLLAAKLGENLRFKHQSRFSFSWSQSRFLKSRFLGLFS